MIVLQSTKSADSLQINGLPSLLGEFPVLKISNFTNDNDFPALEWIKYACKRSI